jgi:hypothetical protein
MGVPLVLRDFGTIDPVGVFYPAGSVLRVFEGRLRDRIRRLRADLTCFCEGRVRGSGERRRGRRWWMSTGDHMLNLYDWGAS